MCGRKQKLLAQEHIQMNGPRDWPAMVDYNQISSWHYPCGPSDGWLRKYALNYQIVTTE